MPAPSNISWPDLFSSNIPGDSTLELQVIRKSGRPFLFVPSSGSLAAHSLSLYPAQTGFAKLAKAVLRAALLTRLPLSLGKTSITFPANEPFPRFLADLIDARNSTLPPLAILAGNPGAEGRRFVLLLFDEHRQPAFVVKAGVGDSARQLIRQEASFLHSAPPGTPGLPLLRGSFDAGAVSAFALEYADGNSPGSESSPEMCKLLSSWINQQKQIVLGETPMWRTLEKAVSDNPLFVRLSQKLAYLTIHPTIFHGDFAPWNIKVSRASQTWCVLDWERGDLTGIPGWDWFHYLIQSAILIHKQTPEQLVSKIAGLLTTTSFQTYSRLAGINGHDKLLVVAYLFYLINLVRPSEGLETNKSLLSLLTRDLAP